MGALLEHLLGTDPTRSPGTSQGRRGPWVVALGALLLGVIGCGRRDTPPPEVERVREFSVPARDGKGSCVDVADVRACWSGEAAEGCAHGICAVPRPVPDVLAATEMGFRCFERDLQRRCVDRARDVGAFACRGGVCVQLHPRLPDDGEWQCADLSGVVVCTGGMAAAGVPEARPAAGFICGKRRRTALEASARARKLGSRLCVDLSPDVPDAEPAAWRCRFDAEPVLRRICERNAEQYAIGSECGAERACVDGSACVAGRCLPRRIAAECWLDADCAPGVCRFGACSGGAP